MEESNRSNGLLDAALAYATQGLAVFLLRPGTKKPLINGWREESTTDENKIREWWTKYPGANIGVDCGKSGLIVLDFDAAGGKNGLAERERFHKEYAATATWTVKTARGGCHEYYKDTSQSGNRTGLYGCVDVRAVGGFVVAPPSVFVENGQRFEYRWEKPPGLYALAEAGAAVRDFIAAAPESMKKNRHFQAPTAISEGSRTSTLLALVGSLAAKGLSAEAIESVVRAENEAKCSPPLTEKGLADEVFPALSRGWEPVAPYDRDRIIDPVLLEKVKTLDPANTKKYAFSDLGNAQLFMNLCGDSIRYVTDRRKWYHFDGVKWTCDEESVKELLKGAANALIAYSLSSVQDESRRQECLKFYGKWQQLHTRETILKDAQSVNPARLEDFDRDPFILNCKNGVLNLHDFSFREHRPSDLLSKVAGAEYVPGAVCERWIRFIEEITNGDAGLAGYLQRVAGYTLTGSTKFDCLFLLYGPTARNGKSTLLETVSRMLGDYAATGSPETLAKKKFVNGAAPSPDLARLAGVRLVHLPEPERGLALNGGLLKQLTGGDPVTARFLDAEFFEYRPQFKLFLNANHLPRIDDLTVFTSGRMRVIPFDKHFSEEEQDVGLKDRLTAPEALSGVLNWCIDGLKSLRAEGFQAPEAARRATEAYRLHEDKLSRFLTECCEVSPEAKVSVEELHNAFSLWCQSGGLASVSKSAFRQMLEEHQFTLGKSRIGDAKNPVATASGLKLVK